MNPGGQADAVEMNGDNLEVTATTTSTAAPIAVYLYAGDQIIENATTGNLYFQDSLGNTSHVTDSAGNLLESYTYSAFGQPSFFNSTSQPLNSSTYNIKHLFQGQLWTQETGLNDYRNRVELPTMGVFLQPDPIGFKGDAANVYRFCNNNAVNRTDPMGMFDVVQIDFNRGLQGPGRDSAQRMATNNLDALSKLALILAQISGPQSTPIRNPKAKAYAEVVWGGETPIDTKMTRSEIEHRYRGDGRGATTANYPDATIEWVDGKPLIKQVVTATVHLANNLSNKDYNDAKDIEQLKSVRYWREGASAANVRVHDLVLNISDAQVAKNLVTSSIRDIVWSEMQQRKAQADYMGGNRHP